VVKLVHMKKYFLFAFVFTLLALSTAVLAQSTNWADYGLSENDVKNLTEKEKAQILKSYTPEQSVEVIRKEIEKSGTSSVQDKFPLINLGGPVDQKLSGEVVDCFSYYKFGSIDANIMSQSSSAVSGMAMNFFGDIKNKNNYPIVVGTLYVKIFRNVGGEKNPNGPDVVDQFIAVDNISIPANGSVPVKFSWKVPAYAQKGDYQLVTYFTVDKKFNLLGLSFTDDIVGNSFNFKVNGESKGVAFDKSSVVINKTPYYFAMFPPRIPKENNADISIKVNNTTNTEQAVKIKWKLYKWDGINPSNLIREFSNSETVKASSSSLINFSIPEKDEPVYYLVGELVYKDSKSVVAIRFVRDGVDKLRLNFPSITSFPLIKGEAGTVFSCLHNSGQSSQVPNSKVVLEIRDESGKVVESYTYEGIVTGDMMAVKKDFISKSTLDVFSVHASLYNAGKLVDESTMKYDCNEIDPSKCIPDKEWIGLIALVGGILALILIFVFMKLSKRNKSIITPVVMFLFAICLFSPHVSEAKSDWALNGVENKKFGSLVLTGAFGTTWYKSAFRYPNIQVKYNVEVRNVSTNALIAEGDSVPVGTNIILKILKHESADVYWVGTGFDWDSPYGEWRADATPPAVSCVTKDKVEYEVIPGYTSYPIYYDFFIPLVVAPPTKTITPGNNLSCGAMSGSETTGYSMNCTVTGAGVINPQFNFSNTKGQFYFRYMDITPGSARTCVGNNATVKPGDFTNNYNIIAKASDFNIDTNYFLNVPTKTISYSMTAASSTGNQPPNSPVIVGPSIGLTSTQYSFTLTATDPDGDQISYGIDWDNNNVVDEWSPIINSGSSSVFTKSWSTASDYTFKAITIDEHGGVSNWANKPISINSSDTLCGNATAEKSSFWYVSGSLCASGASASPAVPNDNGLYFSWDCIQGNDIDNCTAVKNLVPGVCGTADGIGGYPEVSSQCYGGVAGIEHKEIDGKWTWKCQGNIPGYNDTLCPEEIIDSSCVSGPLYSCSNGKVFDNCGYQMLCGTGISCVGDKCAGSTSCGPLDGITLQNGEYRKFYSSRFGQPCNGQNLYCLNGKFTLPGYNTPEDIFRYRSCIAPAFNEF
jgi:hypothetical protein